MHRYTMFTLQIIIFLNLWSPQVLAGTSITPLRSLSAYSTAPACVQVCLGDVSANYLRSFNCYNQANPATCLCVTTKEPLAPLSTILSALSSCVAYVCPFSEDVSTATALWSDYCVANNAGPAAVVASTTVSTSTATSRTSTMPPPTSSTSSRTTTTITTPTSTSTLSLPQPEGDSISSSSSSPTPTSKDRDNLSRPAEIGTIVGTVFGFIAIVVAVVGIYQVRKNKKEATAKKKIDHLEEGGAHHDAKQSGGDGARLINIVGGGGAINVH